jgi:hypothetical protein
MILGYIGGATILESIFGSLLIGLVTFSLLVDYKVVGPASDVLSFFSRGITMPGVIFSLSIDGIIFLILVKVLFGIISILISIVLTIVGVTIAGIVSLFTFIPLIISNHKDQ